jgi:hypothetical protein
MRLRRPGRRSAAALAVGLIGLVSAPVAGGATPIGEAFDPTQTCEGGYTYIQNSSPADSYAAPTDGVITSWSMRGGVPQTTSRLKVVRRVAQGVFLIVGEGDIVSAPAGALVTSPTRVPVQAGDIIGIHFISGRCYRFAGGFSYASFAGDPPVGTTQTFSVVASPLQFDVAASLEPDADNDGFGDETQDACPADPAVHENPCDRIAPSAAITKRPKDKTKKKIATFEFSGTDSRALASFQCSVDGGAFVPCTSPHTVKVKKGKHSFQVRAIDQAGNVGSPSTDDWKVKKKKRGR